MATVRLEKAHKKELKYLKKAEMSAMHIQEREVSINAADLFPNHA